MRPCPEFYDNEARRDHDPFHPRQRPHRTSTRAGSPVSEPSAGRFVGQSVRRREDPRLLTGHGQYVDDIVVPGMLA